YGVDVVQRSFAFDPPLHRFLVLLAKLLTGRPLTVLAVGGSISAAGHLPGGVMHGTATYGQALLDWLQQVFPTPPSTPPHRLIRAFLPGAGSYVLHFCTGELLGALWADGEEQRRAAGEADVVLLECAANDWSVLQPGMAPPPEACSRRSGRGVAGVLANDWSVLQPGMVPRPGRWTGMVAWHGGMAWWHGMVAWRGGMAWWHGMVAWRGGMAWWHGVVAWHGGIAWCHGVVAWHGGMAWWHGVVAWRGGMAWWHGMVAWRGGTAWWHGVVAWRGGMAWWHGVVAWRGGMLASLTPFTTIPPPSSPTCPASAEPPSEPAAKPRVLSMPSSEPAENLTWAHMFVDRVHPSAAGHGMAGSLAAHRIFSLALHYLRREGLSLSRHHLRLDWVDGKAAPSTQSALLCPPTSLCRKCFGDLGFSALGPPLSAPCMLPPLQSAADPHPRCVLGNTWNVSAVGAVEFPEGYTAVREAASKGDAASVKRIAEANATWVQEACGPLVSRILCWKAQAARAPLRVAVDVRGVTRGIGVVYKMLDWTKQEHKMDGADVKVNGRDVGFLQVPVVGNTLTHWRLNSSLIHLEDGEVHEGRVSLTIVPRTKRFHMVALVVE
ncbi:unnamed protein product, partial [Closterium sp. NIES-54]